MAKKKPAPAPAPELTEEQLAAVIAFAEKYGAGWKTILSNAWLAGRDAAEPGGCYLRQIRNALGPRWLKSFELTEVSA